MAKRKTPHQTVRRIVRRRPLLKGGTTDDTPVLSAPSVRLRPPLRGVDTERKSHRLRDRDVLSRLQCVEERVDQIAALVDAIGPKLALSPVPAEASPAAGDAMTIAEFCRRNDIGRTTFFELAKKGQAPARTKAGRAVRISFEAEAAWRRKMENGGDAPDAPSAAI